MTIKHIAILSVNMMIWWKFPKSRNTRSPTESGNTISRNSNPQISEHLVYFSLLRGWILIISIILKILLSVLNYCWHRIVHFQAKNQWTIFQENWRKYFSTKHNRSENFNYRMLLNSFCRKWAIRFSEKLWSYNRFKKTYYENENNLSFSCKTKPNKDKKSVSTFQNSKISNKINLEPCCEKLLN